MKPSRSLYTPTLALIGSLIMAFSLPLHGQTTTPSPSEGVQWTVVEGPPHDGTFWSLQRLGGEPPYPFNPFPWLPTYATTYESQFIFDDSSINYDTLREDLLARRALRRLQLRYAFGLTLESALGLDGGLGSGLQLMDAEEGPPAPGERGEEEDPMTYEPAYDYPTDTLWLEIISATNGYASLVLHGTETDQIYEILSRVALTNVPWTSEGTIIGATGQDWTPTSVPLGDRTNTLFFWARSWMDSDGGGLPDWWQLQYFVELGVDSYGDPDGDGWTNLQEYQNGTNPNGFDTPAAPQGFKVTFNASNGAVQISWLPASGSVTGYTIVRFVSETGQQTNFTATAGAVSLSDVFPIADPDPRYYGYWPTYQIQALYAAGGSAWGSADLFDSTTTPTIEIVRGQNGVYQFVAKSPFASGTSAVRIHRFVFDPVAFTWSRHSFDLAVGSFTDGVATMPSSLEPPVQTSCNWYAQAVSSSGGLSSPCPAGAEYWTPFFDGRVQLKQNLNFLLRIPVRTLGFGYFINDNIGMRSAPANYAFASFFESHSDEYCQDLSLLNEFLPFEDNYFYRNFVFSPGQLDDAGYLTTGVTADYADDFNCAGNLIRTFVLEPPMSYEFQVPTNLVSIAPLMGSTVAQWTFSSDDYSNVGITPAAGQFYMTNGTRNHFGLQFLSAKFATNATGYITLERGGSIPENFGAFYVEADMPSLQTTNYYFAQAGVDLLPGNAVFSPSNSTPLLVAGVGSTMRAAGFSKQKLMNTTSNVYAYLGQYFDKAFRMTNDVVTTNETGILSPYGEFFPTESGPTALVTMPDLDTNERGTAVVHVVKLQTDVDHNGFMDLSFAGPDNTSQARPLLMWVNNDYDFAQKTVFGVPYEPGRDIEVTSRDMYRDYDYSTISSPRDLEDFARLWICGMPALATNAGYQVTLSWNVSSGSPAVNLVRAAETNGGMLYLTDTNIALTQTSGETAAAPNYKFARITPSQPYTFPATFFTNSGNKYFLFEGAAIGKGELVMTILQGSNVLAQTSMWLDLHDVKDFYEQVHVTGVTNVPPISGFLSSGYQQLNWVDSRSDEDTNVIVFVHGWRMGMWDYWNFSESMFKRLYWQGYRGRFISVRWDTLSKDDYKLFSTIKAFTSYNSSEYRAWESAKGVSDYLTYLKQERFPNYNINVCAHSMGNVVVAEALKLQLAAGQHNINNCVFMQAAVPASCYDTSFTNYAPFIAAEQSQRTPNTYHGYPGSIGNAVSGHLVNFFNTNDFALATGTIGGYAVSWEANQKSYKPDTGFGYTTDGTNGWRGLTLMTESREIMSFVSRPRSKAVGAQPNVGGRHFQHKPG